MQTTPAEIPDPALLQLLGEILRPDASGSATSGLRLQLLRPGFSWRALIELALEQGVLLPLTFALTTRALSPPIPRSTGWDDHVSVQLNRVYALHLAHREREQRQLQLLIELLGRAGVAVLLLKGARYLVDPVADWSDARAMGDFDILIHRGDVTRAETNLVSAGYRRVTDRAAPYQAAQHLQPLQHPDHPMTVEIHVGALTPAGDRILSTGQVWDRAKPAESSAALVLPTAWHALHGLLHHQVQDRGHALRKLCVKGLWEWSMLARTFADDDWIAIRTQMRAAGALDVLDSWSIQSCRLFGLEPPWRAEISATARHHADATLRRASRPRWIRRAGQLADELGVSFARETLAIKYDVPLTRVSLQHAGRNFMELLQRHRGGLLRRLTGDRRQP